MSPKEVVTLTSKRSCLRTPFGNQVCLRGSKHNADNQHGTTIDLLSIKFEIIESLKSQLNTAENCLAPLLTYFPINSR